MKQLSDNTKKSKAGLEANLVEQSPDSIFLVNRFGYIESTNKSCEELLGYSSSEFLGKHFTKLGIIQAKSIPRALRIFADYMKGRFSDVTEWELIRKDKTKIIVEAKAKFLPESRQVLVVLRDITLRRKAEKTLRESEETLRLLFERSDLAIIYFDTQERIVLINKKAASYIGQSPYALIGKSIYDILDKNTADIFMDCQKQSLDLDDCSAFESEFKLPAGNVWFSIRHYPIKDDKNHIVGVQTILNDITKQKKSESLLDDAYHEFKLFKELLDNVLKNDSFEDTIEFILSIFSKICKTQNVLFFRYEKEQHQLLLDSYKFKSGLLEKLETLIGYKIDLFSFKPNLNDGRIFNDALQTGEVFILSDLAEIDAFFSEFQESRILRRAIGFAKNLGLLSSVGGIPLVTKTDIMGMILFDTQKILSSREIVRINRVGQLISVLLAKLISEEALKESEARYKSITEQTPDAIFIIDLEDKNVPGKIVEVNKAACQMHGYSDKELIGKSISFLDETETAKHMSERLNVLMSRKTLYFEGKHIRKDGTIFPVEVIARIIDISGKTYVLAIDRDISKRKEAENLILEEKEKAELYLDLLGHDISNRCQPVISYMELLKNKDDFPVKYKSFINQCYYQAQDIAKLIFNVNLLTEPNNFSDLLKIEDMFTAFNESKEKILNVFSHKTINITSTIKPKSVYIRSNSFISNAIEYILENAIRHNKNNVVNIEVNHTVSNDNKFWKIEIKDNGIGISDNMKTQILTRKSKEKSKIWTSGLSLTVVNLVIASCGGKIWIEDRVKNDPSQGTNVVLLLPKMKKKN